MGTSQTPTFETSTCKCVKLRAHVKNPVHGAAVSGFRRHAEVQVLTLVRSKIPSVPKLPRTSTRKHMLDTDILNNVKGVIQPVMIEV